MPNLLTVSFLKYTVHRQKVSGQMLSRQNVSALNVSSTKHIADRVPVRFVADSFCPPIRFVHVPSTLLMKYARGSLFSDLFSANEMPVCEVLMREHRRRGLSCAEL